MTGCGCIDFHILRKWQKQRNQYQTVSEQENYRDKKRGWIEGYPCKVWRLFKKDCRWEKVSLMPFVKEDVDNNGDGFMGTDRNKWNTSNIIE